MAASGHTEPGLEHVADLCLMHLIGAPELLAEFMSATGYDGASLKAALDTDALKRGLIDYVAGNEPVMLAICANSQVTPTQFMALWQRLNHAA